MVVVEALHDEAAALADELPTGAGASFQAFFDHAGLDAAAGGGEGEEEELEWLSNKDAFPALETMAAAAGAPPRAAVGPRTKGMRRRRRVVAWNFPPMAPPPPQPESAAAPGRRCRHCEAEETPQWRAGPEGPRTLCNACGVRYKTGRLVPEYRPANSPTFSPELHSNSHRRILEMRSRKESGDGESTAGARGRRASRAAAAAGK